VIGLSETAKPILALTRRCRELVVIDGVFYAIEGHVGSTDQWSIQVVACAIEASEFEMIALRGSW